MFPEIDCVKGESKDKTHAKQIDALSWLAAAAGQAEPVEVAFAGSATGESQKADPQRTLADPLKKRAFWEGRTPRRALALGLVVLVGLGGYAWHQANCRPLPAAEARFRLTAAPGASSSAPAPRAALDKADLTLPPSAPRPVPLPEETPVEPTLPSEADATPGAAGREADDGTVAADGGQERGRERLQRGPAAGHAHDNPSGAFAATTLGARVRWKRVDRPRPPARPSLWQWLFGHKETKKAKPAKPRY